MDDSEAVEERVACFLLYHGVHDGFPPCEAISILDGVCYDSMLYVPVVDTCLFGTIVFSRLNVGVDAMRLKECVLVTEVPAGWGCAGPDLPFFVG